MKHVNIQTPGGKRFLYATLGMLAAFPALSTDLYLPGFPAIAAGLHTTIETMQITLALNFFGMGIGQLIWGPISDRRGRKGPAIIGIAVFVFASLLCALAPNVYVLMAARALQGLGGSAAVVVGRAIIRDLYHGQEMARVLATVSSIFLISPMLGPLLGAGVLQISSWHFIFVALAVIGTIVIWMTARLPESLPQQRRLTSGMNMAMRDYGKIIVDREFRFGAIQAGIGSFMIFTFVSSLPAVMMGHFGLTSGQFSIIFGINAFFLIVGSRVNHRLLKHRKVTRVLRYAIIFQASSAFALFAFGTLTGMLWVILPLLVATTFAGPTIGGNSTTLALHHFKDNAAQAAALVGVFQNSAASAMMALVAVLPISPLPKMLGAMGLIGVLALCALAFREYQARKHNIEAI